MAPRTVAEQQFFKLIGENVSMRAAARAAGIPPTSAHRLLIREGIRTDGAPFGPYSTPGGTGQVPANIPPPSYYTDQAPPVTEYEFKPGYHDHTFRSFAAPIAFDNFEIDRIRNAVSAHRQGIFFESSLLAYACLSFGPILAATQQRISPTLALPRKILGGTRGVSRMVKEEIEAQLAPRDGLAPAPYFPSTLWGAMDFDLTFLGFSVLQHVLGEPDPDTNIRSLYTRRWPSWAVQYYPYRRTFVAITSEGPVDILNDGKFTLVADIEEPHLLGAIIPLGDEALDGKMTQRARASYIDKYGNPKWIGTMPPNVAVRSPEGEAFFAALSTIRGPDGVGVIPNGATFDIKGLDSSKSSVFKDGLDSNWAFVAAILLGSDGTMKSGSGGVYQSPTFEGVARRLIDRNLKCMLRATNSGHVITYSEENYRETINETPSYVQPVIDIPLPDPEADARIDSHQTRLKKFHEIIDAERKNGFEITQERVEQLANAFSIEVPTITVTSSLPLGPQDIAKVVTVDEARKSRGLEPIGDERGKMFISQLDAPGDTAKATDNIARGEPANTEPPQEPEPKAEPAPEPQQTAADLVFTGFVKPASPMGDPGPVPTAE